MMYGVTVFRDQADYTIREIAQETKSTLRAWPFIATLLVVGLAAGLITVARSVLWPPLRILWPGLPSFPAVPWPSRANALWSGVGLGLGLVVLYLWR